MEHANINTASDARFWDRSSRKYSKSAITDEAGYERTLDRTRALLKPDHRVLELGCGTGTTALRLASNVHTYLATDISAEMIAIAKEKRGADLASQLVFSTATAEIITPETSRFDVILGFNYLHLVRDLPGTLQRIHSLLVADGLFISKTACVGDMNPLLRLALPLMRAIGKAPYVSVLRTEELCRSIGEARFDILATEFHASKGKDARPYIVARKK